MYIVGTHQEPGRPVVLDSLEDSPGVEPFRNRTMVPATEMGTLMAPEMPPMWNSGRHEMNTSAPSPVAVPAGELCGVDHQVPVGQR